MLDTLAASGRAVVAFPAGTGSRPGLLTWNGGNCCGEAVADDSADVAFTAAIVECLRERLPLDSSHVHATGMSNGAMMAYRVAAELAGTIASVAAVAGPLALPSVAPVRPVPVVHFHGTLDQFTPLEGGVGRRSVSRVAHRPVLDGLLDFVRANGCDAACRREVVPCTDEGLSIERFSWRRPGDGAADRPDDGSGEVVFYRIEGGGHTWPGRQPDSFYLGRSAISLDASGILWDFFLRHPLERPQASGGAAVRQA
jgi:polyhydroxybutyrate depolymerase